MSISDNNPILFMSVKVSKIEIAQKVFFLLKITKKDIYRECVV